MCVRDIILKGVCAGVFVKYWRERAASTLAGSRAGSQRERKQEERRKARGEKSASRLQLAKGTKNKIVKGVFAWICCLDTHSNSVARANAAQK